MIVDWSSKFRVAKKYSNVQFTFCELHEVFHFVPSPRIHHHYGNNRWWNSVIACSATLGSKVFATYNCCWLFTSIVSEVGCHGHLSCPLFKMVWISKKGKHLPFFMKKRSKLKSLLRVRLSFLMRMIWDYGIITLSKKKKAWATFRAPEDTWPGSAIQYMSAWLFI